MKQKPVFTLLQVQAGSEQLCSAALGALKHMQPQGTIWIDHGADDWDVVAFIYTDALRAKHQAASAMQPRDPKEIAATLCSLLNLPESYHALRSSGELAHALSQRQASADIDWSSVSQVLPSCYA